MNLLLGLLIIGALVFQWLSQGISFRIFTVWRINFHRDEWPLFYWCFLALELGFGLYFICSYFVGTGGRVRPIETGLPCGHETPSLPPSCREGMSNILRGPFDSSCTTLSSP